MTEVTTARPGSPATRREDAALLAFATLLVLGLFADGWAHTNIVDELEGFVTAWHAIVFVGFALTAGWILLLVQRRRHPSRSLRTAIPRGYQGAAAAVIVFAVGFNGDAVWHTVFGLESDIDALLSPTHLVMAVALLTIVSTPFRATAPAAQQTWSSEGTRIGSLLLTTLVTAFFLLYLWIPAFNIGSQVYGDWLAGFDAPAFMTEVSQIAVLAATFVITAVVVVPALLLTRESRPPTGAVAVLVLLPATAVTAIREFSNPQSLVAFVAAAVVAEVVVARSTDPRVRGLLLGGLLPAVLWPTYWLTFAAIHGVGWEVELYAGQVVSTVLAGLGLAALTDAQTVDAERRPARPSSSRKRGVHA